MKILLVTRGSQGDVYPYLSIASELKRRGHEVTLNLPQIFEKQAKSYQLNYVLQEFDDIEGMVGNTGGKQNITIFLKWMRDVIESQFRQLVPLLEQHDVLVSTNSEFAVASVAEYCKKPLVRTAFAPFIPGKKIPPPVIPLPKPNPIIPPSFLWKMLNLSNNFMTKKVINKNRKILGLEPVKNCGFYAAEASYNYLLFSRYLGNTDPDWKYKWDIGGYCFNDTLQYDEVAYSKLMSFIRKDEKPTVFFTLGSCSAKDSNRFCEMLLTVCRKNDFKLVVGSGWSNTGAQFQNDEHLFLMKQAIPHSLIFPNCSAAIHHGGCGTTHSVARAGIPQMVVPLIIDQPYWAYRISELQLGPEAVKISRVSADELERKVCDLVRNETYKKQATEMGAKIRSERSVENVCDFIESLAKK